MCWFLLPEKAVDEMVDLAFAILSRLPFPLFLVIVFGTVFCTSWARTFRGSLSAISSFAVSFPSDGNTWDCSIQSHSTSFVHR